ncbi:HipA domain-containing protein [bacterium]|nr:HipA domain-containing protein [bacterium]MBU1917623.1 HipA domain-containing protein [bacterium]
MGHCLQCNQPLNKDNSFYGQHADCFKEIFQVDHEIEFQSLARKNFISDPNDHNLENNDPHLTSYFAGNYKKYEGKLGEHSYILKLSKEEYPELAPVEYICNKIGYYCQINIATPFTLIDLGNHELAFVTKNFMANTKSHASLNAIYHYLDAGPTNYNVENISAALFKETRSASDVIMFFKTLLFDALIGNHDRHGRNFSLIETQKQKRLSPIYDNPSYLGLEKGSALKANIVVHGKVWTKNSQEPDILAYAKEIKRLNAGHILKDFVSSMQFDKIAQLIQESHCLSNNMKQALYKMVIEQYEKLVNYV